MTGFNLPPGCNVSDIPGNRPEDAAEEAFWDALHDRAHEDGGHALAESVELLLNAPQNYRRIVELARDLGLTEGFAQGRDDQRMAEAAERQDEWEQKWLTANGLLGHLANLDDDVIDAVRNGLNDWKAAAERRAAVEASTEAEAINAAVAADTGAFPPPRRAS